jgi:SAM-dependent methyltransferase
MNDTIATAAAYWDRASKTPRKVRTRWWESPTINRHINAKVCGQPIEGIHAGFHRLISEAISGTAIQAISVGCGIGHKEMLLIQSGVVEHFDLYEISAERIKAGRDRAQKLGIDSKVSFHLGEAFEVASDSYDLVYWNNSLHHMPDTAAAIQWSQSRLRPGGVFAMDEFVGPTRFQWSDINLEYADLFRRSIGPKFLVHPQDASRKVSPVTRPTIERMMALDPSESADSSSIYPAFSKAFPEGKLIFTGGAIYHLALNDVLANLDEDGLELVAALALDDALSALGTNHYAVGIAKI